MGTTKEEFLKEFGEDYGYPHGPKSVDEIRATEFKRLDGLVYLDHAGATLYSELQMDSIFKDLTSNVYGNPHSQSDSSTATSDIVKDARQQVLDYCKASPKDYKCIFTSGATAALKLVGEAFPWSHQSSFMYTRENHNSVLGIREYALNQGAQAFAVDVEDLDFGASKGPFAPLSMSRLQIQKRNEPKFRQKRPPGDTYNLFAFPSECNFSGLKFNLELVKVVKGYSWRMVDDPPFCNGHWMVLVDAAKGCATKPPDLSKHPADFVVVSFYKLFGYPTGLGALIIHKDAAKLLNKTYFSGGTVAASISDIDYVKRREGIEELFEDGTASFLSIASLRYGFKVLNTLTTHAIFRHTTSLTWFVRKSLLAMRHENGSRVCVLYGSCVPEVLCNELGPIVTFNLKRPDGSWFGHREVEKLASLSAIQLRTGCFCNPGACAKYLGLSHSDLLSNIEAGHVCWDDCDVIHGKPTGAVRVSFGYMSTYEDAKKFIDFVTKSFMCRPNQSGHECQVSAMSVPHPDEDLDRRLPSGYLKSITIYPVKSCAGFSVDKWPLSTKGLRYDREWVLQGLNGEILTQKKVPGMGLVGTFIDLNEGILFVESPFCKERLQINLISKSYSGGIEELHLYGKRYEVQGYDNEVNAWFSTAIGRQCALLHYLSCSDYVCLDSSRQVRKCRDSQTLLNFSNEAQMLLISEESVADLNKRLRTNGRKDIPTEQIQVNPMRFRPNLVISGGRPYAEDEWRSIKVGNKYFSSVGGCNRCQMINFSIESGLVSKSNEPLATLATYRRDKGRILFGLLLKYEPNNNNPGQGDELWLQVGEEIHSNTV